MPNSSFNPELAVGVTLRYEHRERSITMPISVCIRCLHIWLTKGNTHGGFLRFYTPLSYAVASELHLLGAKGCSCDVCDKPFVKETP